MTDRHAEGYDVDAVETWVRDNVPALKPPFSWTRLEGGHSNLTYRIVDSTAKEAVIRRPPQGELLPKAHDMSREWSLISALGPTDVPVPEAIAFCESPDVTGAWFYIMGHIDGRPLYSREDTEAWVPLEEREAMAYDMVDVLAALHALDPDEIGLGDLGKTDSYVGRQLRTWYRSWMASIEPAGMDDPRAHALQTYFTENLPDQGKARVVHGDYATHNVLIGPNARVAAVVDWEISTLGDPMADLAYFLNVWSETEAERALNTGGAGAPGFPPRSKLAARYAEKSGRSLELLDYYIGFNRWKTAAIIHGVYARYMAGQKSTEGVDLEGLRTRITQSLDLAEEAVNRIR